MKSIVIIFATLLYTIAIPFMFTAIDDMVTDDISQSYALVNTGASTNQSVILSQSLHKNAVAFINSVTSNITGDSPTAATYNSVSKAVLVTGLIQSSNRTLTVNYAIAKASLPSSATLFLDTLIRWFFIFSVIGLWGGAVYAFFQT